MSRYLIALVPLGVLAAAALWLGGNLLGSDEVGPRGEGSASVRQTKPRAAGVSAHLRALARIASENGGNRAAGRPGEAATVRYIVGRLRAAGWRVRLQPLPFPYFEELRSPRLRSGGRTLRARREVRSLTYSPSGLVSGRLRGVGEGCEAASVARAVEAGEIAAAARGTCTFEAKARNAERAGATALLIANEGSGAFSGSLREPGVAIPVLAISESVAAGLEPGARARVSVRTVSETRRTHNVLAETPSAATGRVAMAGGHLDSVPAGPGLNDNASGVAALLDVAERLDVSPAGPRVRLGFWGAEELGLIGSRHYVRSLRGRERRRVAAYLNLDMVGSPRPRPSVYSDGPEDTARRFGRRLRSTLRRLGVTARTRTPEGFSDHASFARAGIPIGGLFTGADPASDRCYHRACDDLDNVEVGMARKMARAAQSVFVDLSARAARSVAGR